MRYLADRCARREVPTQTVRELAVGGDRSMGKEAESEVDERGRGYKEASYVRHQLLVRGPAEVGSDCKENGQGVKPDGL
jgi:hypothetical protein